MHSRSDHVLGATAFDGTVSAGETRTADLERFGITVVQYGDAGSVTHPMPGLEVTRRPRLDRT